MSKTGRKEKNAGKLNLSAGILVFRKTSGSAEVLLAHPGGPFWKNKDNGVWTIPKGEPHPGEDNEAAARREFAEESGWDLRDELLQPLMIHTQPIGHRLHRLALTVQHQPTQVQLALHPLVRPWQAAEHLSRERLQTRPDLVHLLRSHRPDKITAQTGSAGTTHLTKYY